jgi:monoamine oxidase
VLKKIEFDPPLPEWKRESIDSLQMASFEKIAIKLAPGTLDGVDSFERGCGSDREGRSTELLVKPWGKDVAVVMVGGDLAKEILKQPAQQSIDFAIDVMTQHYGDIFRAAFEHGERTEWTLDPYIGGTWAVSTTNSKDFDRTAYSAPVEDTLFISGEACAGEWMTSVNGAFFNGRDVARQAFSIHAARAAI